MDAIITKEKFLSCTTADLAPHTQQVEQGNCGQISPIKRISQVEDVGQNTDKGHYKDKAYPHSD